MKLPKSLRVKLTALYLLTNVISIGIIALAMPSYYNSVVIQDRQILTAATLTSLTSNIDTYLDDLDRLTLIPYFNDEVMQALKAKAYPTFTSQAQLLIANQALYSTFSKYLQEARQDVVSTVVLPIDGSVFIGTKDDFSPNNPVPYYPFAQQSWYQKALAANGRVIYINPHQQDYLSRPLSSQVFSVARLIKDPDTFHPLAIIMADADTNILKDIVSGIKLNVRSIIAVLGTDKQPICSTVPLPRQVWQEIASRSTLIHAPDDSYVPVIKQTALAQWDVVILLSQSETNANVRWLYMVGILCTLGGSGLAFLAFASLSRRIIHPFRHMMDVMRKVQQGDLQTRIVTRGEDEIAVLGNAFNTMLVQLNDLIDREYKATLSLRNAEYHALQSQIEPHFLYNTLNGFIGLNRAGQQRALEKAILSLGAMLRYVLSNEEWVTLKEEFRFLQKYCDLQKMRFQEKMIFVFQYDDILANFKIPKVLLQPLVENSVIHGMEPAASPCTLQVRAQLKCENEAQALWISIQDNGVGFDVKTQQDKRGLGLSNVRERLKLAYEYASLSITSQVGEGTQVVIVIPVTEGEL